MYLRTRSEPWPGGYNHPTFRPRAVPTTRFARSTRAAQWQPRSHRAVNDHGAHPVCVALPQAGAAHPRDTHGCRRRESPPAARMGELAQRRGKGRSLARRAEHQVSDHPHRPRSSSTTWQLDGFVSECWQPASWLGVRTSAIFPVTVAVRFRCLCAAILPGPAWCGDAGNAPRTPINGP